MSNTLFVESIPVMSFLDDGLQSSSVSFSDYSFFYIHTYIYIGQA